MIVREDAGDAVENVVVERIRHIWSCPRCSRPNPKESDVCDFCSWDRCDDNPWKCDMDGHLNHSASKCCEECGVHRED